MPRLLISYHRNLADTDDRLSAKIWLILSYIVDICTLLSIINTAMLTATYYID